MPASQLKKHIAEILKAEGFIADVRDSEDEGPQQPHHRAQVRSRPRQRHRRHHAASRARAAASTCATTTSRACSPGMGVSILSTSRGVMSDREARRQKVGGELLCEVW